MGERSWGGGRAQSLEAVPRSHHVPRPRDFLSSHLTSAILCEEHLVKHLKYMMVPQGARMKTDKIN